MILIKVIFQMRIRFKYVEYRILRAIHSAVNSTDILSNSICVKQVSKHFSQKSVYPLRVLFFGTDNFALQTLKKLNFELKFGNILGCLDVVSSNKYKNCVIKRYSHENGLQVLDWPIKQCIQGYDIGLVASFGHLIPEDIIKSFPLGMLNVHASLLPRWRGAAPVIYAIMNGDEETGVTIMRIMPKRFDVGDMLAQFRVAIGPHDTTSIITDKLAGSGAELLITCLKNLPMAIENAKPQNDAGITYAPKVKPCLAMVKWSETKRKSLYNLWRALYGTFYLITTWHGTHVKLIEACCCCYKKESHAIVQPGHVEYVKSHKILLVTCGDGEKIGFWKIRISGKKTMSAEDFYNGYMSKRRSSECFFV